MNRRIFPEDKRELCPFLYNAWEKGWLDNYDDKHFLIKAIEGRLDKFVALEQLINNNLDSYNIVLDHRNIETETWDTNFCINFSCKMQHMERVFGEDIISKFVKEQLSAGKENYSEDVFFEALSEVSILSFYAGRREWDRAIYEPPVEKGINKKNPEAAFYGKVLNYQNGRKTCKNSSVRINVEVKSPSFPHTAHQGESFVIVPVLMKDKGKAIQGYCHLHEINYQNPRVLKLKDFINSAVEKFKIPRENEYNLLYINWSYSDFPSNGFLEAWSLLSNDTNGIMTHKKIASEIGIDIDAFKKITAIIVYSESLEGLMFSDFRYVWQRNGMGTRFRMFVVNQQLRESELHDRSNILFQITGMNPDDGEIKYIMESGSTITDDEIKKLVDIVKNEMLVDNI